MEENKPQISITAAAVASTSTSTSVVSRVTPIPQPTVTSTTAGARVQAAPLPLHPVPSQASTSSNPRKEAQTVANGARQRFSVELKPGETTIVSWKKLSRESGMERSPKQDYRAENPVDLAPQPGLSASVKPGEDDPKEAVPPLNRFSSVIEKIERLYMGKNSSDEEEELDDAPDDDQYDTEDSFIDDTELDEYFQADNLVTKHTGYFVNKGQLEQISEPSAAKGPMPKKRRRKDPTITTRVYNEQEWKQLQLTNTAAGHCDYRSKHVNNKSSLSSGAQKRNIDKISGKETVLALESRNLVGHSKGLVTESNNCSNSSTREKEISGYIEMNPRKVSNGENEVKIKKEKGEFFEPSTSGSVYPVQPMYQTPIMVRDGTSTRPKGSRLERAIRDLEKIVAECRPQSAEVQEVDPANPTIKRRLPQDVKVKLAKVARLSAGQANISEEQLIDRLMGIVGHLVQRKTLKRNLREMVELGLCAKQEKADRFQHVKKEINEMVKLRVSQLKSKMQEQQANGSGDDFQEVGYSGALKGKYTMDNALEDKICDLYDLYVEGMDEDKGPQCRKLYVELAELWPHGYMDNVGIKEAISRSKERKRALFNHQKVRNEERKKKKLAQQILNPQAKPVQVQQSISSLAIGSQEKPMASINPNLSINPSSGGKSIVDPTALFPDYYKYQGPKKLKRKAESDPGEGQIHRKPVRSKEKLHKLNRHSGGTSSEANAVTDKNTSTNDNPKSDGQGSSLVLMSVGLPGSSDQANILPNVDFPNAS